MNSLRDQYDHNYSDFKAKQKIVIRKLLNAFYSLYMGMQGLHPVIVKHCDSPQIKALGIVGLVVPGTNRTSLREVFSAIGQKHLSFEDSNDINEDLIYRKTHTVGFVPTVSSVNPLHQVRGRKPVAIPRATPIKRESRQSKAPQRYQEEFYTSSSSKRPSRVASSLRVNIRKEGGDESVDTKEEGNANLAKSSIPASAIQSNQQISKEIFGDDSDDSDDSDNPDDSDDKPVLEIKCNQKGLSKLCRAMIQRKPLITATQNTDDKYFSREFEPVLCSIIELAGARGCDLPYKPGTGPCTVCNVSDSENTPVRKCSHIECAELNFCPKHMEHTISYKHDILGGKAFEKE